MKIKQLISNNAPAILLGAGITSFVSAIIYTARVAPTAKAVIDEMEETEGETSTKDKIIAIAPIYAPVVGMGMIGTGCILASNRIHMARYAALFSLYSFGEKNLERWQASVLEEVGEKKAEKIQHRTTAPRGPAPDNFAEDYPDNQWFYDSFSGRYFVSEVETVRAAINDCNNTMYQDDWCPVNDFYYILGLPDGEFGRNVGWASENGSIQVRLDPHLGENNRVIITVGFNLNPRINFN